MNVYMTRPFKKWAAQAGLSPSMLLAAVDEMDKGLVDADLGGGLFKKRIARQGSGKRGGYRVLIVTRYQGLWFFVYGFPKNARTNIKPEEQRAYREFAQELLAYTDKGIQKLIVSGELFVLREE